MKKTMKRDLISRSLDLGNELIADNFAGGGGASTGIEMAFGIFGLGIKLDDWGLDGYALLAPKESEIKAQFDSRRLSLTIEGKTWRLDDKVYVLVQDVDIEKRKIGLEIVSEETAQRLSAWL